MRGPAMWMMCVELAYEQDFVMSFWLVRLFKLSTRS